jgi:FlaA1/EpsC-like NDP-sugar epimerase
MSESAALFVHVDATGRVRGGEPEVMFVTLPIQHLIGRMTLQRLFDIEERITGQSVLVTGAGGSIGSALCHQLVQWKPRRLIAYEQSEYALYQVTRALQASGVMIVPVLGDLTNVKLTRKLMTVFDVTRVFHAAAYKHVPLVEQNPIAGIRNNVWGTKTLIEAARECGIKQVLVVSTDKAVRPTNVMGASKRLAEYVTLVPDQGFQVVRLGNVLWSTGSVLPLFYEQLKAGVPLTITHRETTRYFMSIEEAVELMLQSIALANSIMVLDMGVPVLIEGIARRLAEAMGIQNPEVTYIGLRPGEKLHEELTLGESLTPTVHPLIKAAIEDIPTELQVADWLQELDALCSQGDVSGLRQRLQQIVPGYNPSCGIVDSLWLQEYVVRASEELDNCYEDTR